jgi:hypothetical protein
MSPWIDSSSRFSSAADDGWGRGLVALGMAPEDADLGTIGKHVRCLVGANRIREEVTPHTLRYTCIASLFAAGADQEYVADQVGHEDVTTTNRIYRYVLQRRQRGEIGRRRRLAMRESTVDVGRPEGARTGAEG